MSRNCVGLVQNIKYTLHDIVPRLIRIEKLDLHYLTPHGGSSGITKIGEKETLAIESLPDRVQYSSELKRDTSNLVRN